MKVAAIVYEFPSVSQTFVRGQIEGLLSMGWDVRIFADGADKFYSAGSKSADPLISRVKYFGVPLHGLRDALGNWQAPPDHSSSGAGDSTPIALRAASAARLSLESRAFRNNPPFDVIHAHFGPNGVRAVRLREKGFITGPVVTSFYGYDVGRSRARGGYRQLFDEGDLFIALSDEMRGRLIELGSPSDRTIVHRLGVDLSRFGRALNPHDELFKVVSIARLVEKKGIEYAIRAMAQLAERKIPFRYTVVGEGPLRARLERLATSLGISERVTFAGARSNSEIPEMLGTADVLLAPSITSSDGDAEGTPVAILEAQASGLPVVATRHAGIPEIVSDGVSGFLVDERDVDGVASRLADLSESPSLRATMGSAGRAVVTENHDIHKLNRELESIYRRVAS